MNTKLHQIILYAIFFYVVFGCSKNNENPDNLKTPEISTNAITEITQNSAICNGIIISTGNDSITEQGICWSTHEIPTIADNKIIDSIGTTNFNCTISGLVPNTTYYVCAYAVNSVGTGYGNILTFSTLDESNIVIPSISTTNGINITQTLALFGGNVISNGGETLLERGVCWSTNSNPTIANNKTSNGTTVGSFTSNISELTPNTTYYIRAYATNSVGTGYGDELSFTTKKEIENSSIVTDIQGNTYNTVIIGTQTWMQENLRVTVYNDNQAITLISDTLEWGDCLNTGGAAFCYYNNNESNASNGVLYNWYSVNTGKLCPLGWHVPTYDEWIVLKNYLIENGYNYDGTTVEDKTAKSLSYTSGWQTHDVIGNPGTDQLYNNSSGFSGIPVGWRNGAGGFADPEISSNWWTASTYGTNIYAAYGVTIYSQQMVLDIDQRHRSNGVPVRCVKD